MDANVKAGLLALVEPANTVVGVVQPERRREESRLVSRASLERLDLASYQHLVVLSDDRLPADQADNRALVTLLHLRDIELSYGDPYTIVTELNDDTNREVTQVTKADDFIVSTRPTSLLLTQLLENRDLQPILADLFDPSGAEIKLNRAGVYLREGAEASFATVVESARRKGHTAIGYRLDHDRDLAPKYGVVLNPPKSARIALSANDSIVVVTGD